MNNRKALLIISILCLFYGLFVRVTLLKDHFSHIDDLIPALVETRLEDVEIDGASTLKVRLLSSLQF